MSKIKKALTLCRDYGIRKTFGIVNSKIKSSAAIQLRRAKKLVKKSLKDSETEQINSDIKLSILVPVFNTDADMLKCVIESVLNQTYENTELCIYDASDDDKTHIGKICKEYCKNNSRIKYAKGANLGIAENTNKCFELSEGQYIGLLDHDDVLHKNAAYYVVKAINNTGADFIYTDEAVFKGKITNVLATNFKPDYSPFTLRCNNYICHFTCFSRELFLKNGGFNKKYDGSQDHELFLRLTDNAKKVYHIPKILYFWRAGKTSVATDINAKTYAVEAGINAVKDFLAKKGINARVESSDIYPTIYRIKYELSSHPKVSVIILNNEHLEDLKRCLDSIKKSTYDNYEIIICENNSKSPELFDYYKSIQKNENIKIIAVNRPFNYSEFNNEAAKVATGEYLLFLNNDTGVISENWIEEMLMYAMQENTGAVGAKLFYPDGRIQHCYLITGLGEDGVAVHAGCGLAGDDNGYLDRIGFVQNANAVTAACMLVKKSIFDEVGGFDESLAVAYNDVDFCLKLRDRGYMIVYTPYAMLSHYESSSRGAEVSSKKVMRRKKEAEIIRNKWGDRLVDPYYNSNFSTDRPYVIK